jgi:predicted nucleic acid-binding protein
MPFALDASIAACWAFDDEDYPVAALALERVRTDEARVPSLWWFEVRNTLIASERRGRLTECDTATFLYRLARLRVTVDRSPEEADVLPLARHRGLAVYDAAYLELARREGAPLATLDAALATAARAEQVLLPGESGEGFRWRLGWRGSHRPTRRPFAGLAGIAFRAGVSAD